MNFQQIWKDKKIRYSIIGVISVLLIVVVGYIILHSSTSSFIQIKNNSSQTSSTAKIFPFQSEFDGRGLEQAQESPQIVAVMIDNSADVKIQPGLFEARVVYEALAEGGTTRYMALFEKNQLVEKVGPVRSARMYFLDWAREYGDAMYLHVGGSPEALSFLRSSDMFDINEFGWGGYFWRDKNYLAPHNVFTSSENWEKIYEKQSGKRTSKKWSGWKFDDINSLKSEQVFNPSSNVSAITISYFNNYQILWNYNTSSSMFERLINKNPDKDNKGNQIVADNVIIQFTSTKVVDEVGRRDIVTVGEGEVIILKKGNIIRGSWKKSSETSRTRFYNPKNREISLIPGKTWIQIVPTGTSLEIIN